MSKHPDRSTDAGDPSDGKSLDRLADFVRRVVAVPKHEIPAHKPKHRRKRKRSR